MTTASNTLELLGLSPAAARIIRYFMIRPDARPHARALQRTLDLGGASLQRELHRMVKLGALQKEKEGRRLYYFAVEGAPIWTAMRILEGVSSNPGPLLRDALVDVSGLLAAFIFGSTATGEQHEDSDIDVLVVEEPKADKKTLYRNLAEVGILLGREVNAVRYTTQTLADRLGDPEHPAWGFVRQVLVGPKQWVVGEPSTLAPLAAASGLSKDEVVGTLS
ncbi:MAG: nucleotidyltransferase domain-containing protein [Gemmatimonadota bacterium]